MRAASTLPAVQRGDFEGAQPAALPVSGEPGRGGRQRAPHGSERRHRDHDLHLGGQLVLARPAAGEDAGEEQVKADRCGDGQDKVAQVAEGPRELQPQEASHRAARLAVSLPASRGGGRRRLGGLPGNHGPDLLDEPAKQPQLPG